MNNTIITQKHIIKKKFVVKKPIVITKKEEKKEKEEEVLQTPLLHDNIITNNITNKQNEDDELKKNKLKRKSVDYISSMKTTSSFLKEHIIQKTDQQRLNKEITNTRIGCKEQNIFGGSYHIPAEEYADFINIYFHDVIMQNKDEYLTEKQLGDDGPILIDMDFRYKLEIQERQHTKSQIEKLLHIYLEELSEIYQIKETENLEFPIFVFEKNNVNCIPQKNVTKDGIHILIGLQIPIHLRCYIRTNIIEKIKKEEEWSQLPIMNTWEEVFDEGICKGCINWQLYGSKKPNNEPYKLKYVFLFSNNLLSETSCENYEKKQNNFFQLSARYPNHPSLLMYDSFINNKYFEIEKQFENNNKKKNVFLGGGGGGGNTKNDGYNPETLFQVRNKQELDNQVNDFLENISEQNYEWKETYDYTMSLPETYYNSGSFTKWIRVGWALRNIHNKLFIVWVALSAKYDNFNYFNIQRDLWERWITFDMKNPNGLTKRSIMYWSKQDAYEKFMEIKSQSANFYIVQTIQKMKDANIGSNTKMIGCADVDLAGVIYQMFKEVFVCVSAKSNNWYHFENHKWVSTDSGILLRINISETLRPLYVKKVMELGKKLATIEDPESLLYKSILKEMGYIHYIINKLGSTAGKNCIMTELKDFFYDKDFLKNIDTNPYLLCFKNGVVDFKEKVFRDGKPSDYISKSTNINYLNYQTIQQIPAKQQIIQEIEDFMHKLFPNKELNQYMWEHLASTLIGVIVVQTFNMYIGIGQNGKTKLVELMSKVLGDYKGDVPLTLITQQRSKIGSAVPELVQLKGVRYAVMQEPSKGDKINEGILKQLTGGDPIQCRGLYKEEMITFIPEFRLVVCSNEFMEIKSRDHGTWRRIRVVDFEALFTKNPVTDDPEKPHQFIVDNYISDKFDLWKEVLASMLVEIAYVKNGMVEDCDKVIISSNTYRQEQDYISEFIQDKTEKCFKNGCIHKSALHIVFKNWYESNYSGKVLTSIIKELDSNMEKKYGKQKNGVWHGVKIKDNENSIFYNNNNNNNISDNENDEKKTTNSDDDTITYDEL